MPYIKQFQDTRRSCLSYFVCCPGRATGAVIDPSDNVKQYLDQARDDFADIVAIIDTHIHADHVSGARELSRATGAPVFMHESSKVNFEFEPMREGDAISIGNVDLKALHTPGHTSESMCLLYIDHKRSESPWGIFSGDTLFVGDVGRLDLVGAGTMQDMYRSLFQRILSLEDYLELYPAHYVGSVCGSGMSLKTTSTLGYERRFNPALRARSFEEFERYLTENALQPFPEHVKIKKFNAALQDELAIES
jgi:hydroxyacylglutathione hydrolase